MNLSFRKATSADFDAVLTVYKDGVRSMLESGINQWDDTYPNAEIINNDISKEELYVCLCDGVICAAYVLNCQVDEDYATGNWQYPDSNWIAMHRLCVSPLYHRKGIASACMRNIEETALVLGYDAIHLDTFSGNPKAFSLYKKLGYHEVGDMFWSRGRFVLFEKKL